MPRFTNAHAPHYKVEHTKDRLRFTKKELRELKRQVTGRVETNIALSQAELKVIQEQGEKTVRELERAVSDENIDKNFIIPVVKTETREHFLIGLENPQPTYYQQAINSGITIQVYRYICSLFCLMIIALNTYCLIHWIYSDYVFPLEFFRVMFEAEGKPINRFVLEFKLNLFLSLISFTYALWGLCVSTVFTWKPFVSGFFTWSIVFISPFVAFSIFQVYNLSLLHTKTLNTILLHSLWTYNYHKRSSALTVAWNQAQYSLRCCGLYRREDWYVDWGFWLNRTDKPSNPKDLNRFPESCCPGYGLEHSYDYILRTRNYAIRMLYCQYYPRNYDGCYFKLVFFFQHFSELLIWTSVIQILFMALAALFAFMAHVRYKRHRSSHHNYRYTIRDWVIDFFFIRVCKKVKDSQKKQIGEIQGHLEHDPQEPDRYFKIVRPHLEKFFREMRQIEHDKAEAALDENARVAAFGIATDPLITLIDENDENRHRHHSKSSDASNQGIDNNFGRKVSKHLSIERAVEEIMVHPEIVLESNNLKEQVDDVVEDVTQNQEDQDLQHIDRVDPENEKPRKNTK